jgi:ATP-binding cassette subfamily F protein uup
VSGFNFLGSDQKRAGDLSGGSATVHLAKVLKKGANVLGRANQRSRRQYAARAGRRWTISGSAMIVSHDRWFLDRICTHPRAEEDGGVNWPVGNCSDFEADCARLGIAAETPHRLVRKLMR